MSRPGAGWALAAAAALTTWLSFLSWRGFTEVPADFLRPLGVLAAVVAVTGALLRAWRRPAVVVVLAQAVVSAGTACWLLVGALPVGTGLTELQASFAAAGRSINAYAPPVPAEAAGIDPVLVAGGLGCLLLVDLLACTLGRVPLAGFPLLAVLTVPLGLLAQEPAWPVFAATAGGFLAMLFLQESQRLGSWGRGLPGVELPADRAGGVGPDGPRRVRTSAVRSSAVLVGTAATALAVVLPGAVPALEMRDLGLGTGGGGSTQIELQNPMTDLRRDLRRGQDVPLVRVRTNEPRPSYLRTSVLTRFSENAWTSGDRDIPGDQTASGAMPALEGVDESVPRRTYDYQVEVTEDFRSTWLPTQAPVSEIDAPGDWRYDTATMDFIASDDDLDTASMSYSMTAVDLERDPDRMLAAAAGAGQVSTAFVELPRETPDLVRELAVQVTSGTTSRFGKAVALQEWFRRDGGFTYSLEVDLGNGAGDLVSFLSPEGRTGYCEQFASAMAVMARSLGIPARVAVGFLSPERIGPQTYEYSSWDLHAWPELYIPGAGWTPFEPTPATRASGVPSYTRFELGNLPAPAPSANPSAAPTTSGTDPAPAPTRGPDPAAAERSQQREEGSSLGAIAAWALVALALLGLAAAPGAVRRGRRRQRLAGGPEEIWRELHDSAVDLGLRWPQARTPRETGDWLRTRGCPAWAVDRLVGVLEVARYGRPGTATGGADEALTEAALACLEVLAAERTTAARRRARWWPRTVLRRSAPTRRSTEETALSGQSGEVVEHVG